MIDRRKLVGVVLGLAALSAGGCYEVAWFYPAADAGPRVSNGERLGVAKRLSGEDPKAQSFIVVSVKQAYTSQAGGTSFRTIVQITANMVNRASAPARFETDKTRLEVAGRSFAPKWVFRWPATADKRADKREVAPGAHVRYDLYFDLGPYNPYQTRGYGHAGAPAITGGLALSSIMEFNISWEAQWAGEATTGKFRFVRSYTGGIGSGWSTPPSYYHWGYGWWYWPYAWPYGVVHRRYHPWRYYTYHPMRPWYKPRPGVRLPPRLLKPRTGTPARKPPKRKRLKLPGLRK